MRILAEWMRVCFMLLEHADEACLLDFLKKNFFQSLHIHTPCANYSIIF